MATAQALWFHPDGQLGFAQCGSPSCRATGCRSHWRWSTCFRFRLLFTERIFFERDCSQEKVLIHRAQPTPTYTPHTVTCPLPRDHSQEKVLSHRHSRYRPTSQHVYTYTVLARYVLVWKCHCTVADLSGYGTTLAGHKYTAKWLSLVWECSFVVST